MKNPIVKRLILNVTVQADDGEQETLETGITDALHRIENLRETDTQGVQAVVHDTFRVE